MTYLAFYTDKLTNNIVVLQDTLALSQLDKLPMALMDKVYFHKQSNTLIAGVGTMTLWGIAMDMESETFDSYDEVISYITKSIIASRTLLKEDTPEVFEQYVTGVSVSHTFVFSYDEAGTPKLSTLTLSGADNQIVPVFKNLDKELQGAEGMYMPAIHPDQTASIPVESLEEHSGSLDLFVELAKQEGLSARYQATALFAHLETCHIPISEGGVGQGIGGELVEYRINSEGTYTETTLLTFPENSLHGISTDESRLRMSDMAKITREEDVPEVFRNLVNSLYASVSVPTDTSPVASSQTV